MKPNTDIFKKLVFISEIELRNEIIENCEILNFKRGETIVRQGEYVKVLITKLFQELYFLCHLTIYSVGIANILVSIIAIACDGLSLL